MEHIAKEPGYDGSALSLTRDPGPIKETLFTEYIKDETMANINLF